MLKGKGLSKASGTYPQKINYSTPPGNQWTCCCKFIWMTSGLRYKPGGSRLKGLCSQGSAPAFPNKNFKKRSKELPWQPKNCCWNVRTAAKSHAKMNYKCLTEINYLYSGLSLMMTLTQGLYSVRYKVSWL